MNTYTIQDAQVERQRIAEQRRKRERKEIDADTEVHDVVPRNPEQILGDYTEFLNVTSDTKTIEAEYRKVWRMLNGSDKQDECKRLTGIRINELKQAA